MSLFCILRFCPHIYGSLGNTRGKSLYPFQKLPNMHKPLPHLKHKQTIPLLQTHCNQKIPQLCIFLLKLFLSIALSLPPSFLTNFLGNVAIFSSFICFFISLESFPIKFALQQIVVSCFQWQSNYHFQYNFFQFLYNILYSLTLLINLL